MTDDRATARVSGVKAAHGEYKRQVERHTSMMLDHVSVPPMLFGSSPASDEGLSFSFEVDSSEVVSSTYRFSAGNSTVIRTTRDGLSWSSPYVQTGASPRAPRKRAALNLADGFGAMATALGPLLALVAAAVVAMWCWLVGRVEAAWCALHAWWEAPRRAEVARAEELAAIRAGAADQAEFAEFNGMLVSAHVWRVIAEDDESV